MKGIRALLYEKLTGSDTKAKQKAKKTTQKKGRDK
tara:strand:- start:1067 stop:1171 length:105 start_codon:yes stop_codon:yes gene_type:complete